MKFSPEKTLDSVEDLFFEISESPEAPEIIEYLSFCGNVLPWLTYKTEEGRQSFLLAEQSYKNILKKEIMFLKLQTPEKVLAMIKEKIVGTHPDDGCALEQSEGATKQKTIKAIPAAIIQAVAEESPLVVEAFGVMQSKQNEYKLLAAKCDAVTDKFISIRKIASLKEAEIRNHL